MMLILLTFLLDDEREMEVIPNDKMRGSGAYTPDCTGIGAFGDLPGGI